jgi:hypothetical protein
MAIDIVIRRIMDPSMIAMINYTPDTPKNLKNIVKVVWRKSEKIFKFRSSKI